MSFGTDGNDDFFLIAQSDKIRVMLAPGRTTRDPTITIFAYSSASMEELAGV